MRVEYGQNGQPLALGCVQKGQLIQAVVGGQGGFCHTECDGHQGIDIFGHRENP